MPGVARRAAGRFMCSYSEFDEITGGYVSGLRASLGGRSFRHAAKISPLSLRNLRISHYEINEDDMLLPEAVG